MKTFNKPTHMIINGVVVIVGDVKEYDFKQSILKKTDIMAEFKHSVIHFQA